MRKFHLVGASGVAAVAAGALLFGAGSAYAAPPPYEPTSATVGTISFYNAAGQVITSGRTDTAPFAAYAVGSNAVHSGDNQAALFYANPQPSDPSLWYKEQVGLFTKYPVTAAGTPSSISSLPADTPVNTGTDGDQTIDGFESDSVISTVDGYKNVVQIRLRTATGSQITQSYDSADLSIDPVNHTWTQIYPTPKTATSTTLTASPNPATVGDTVTLTAQETPAAAGSVQFKDGTTNIGSSVAVDSSGKATTTTATLGQGSHNLSAVFTPTDTTTYTGSTGTTVLTENPAATPTSTSLAVTQDGTAGDAATLAATVTGPGTTPNNSGSVSFYDNGSSTALGTVPGSAAMNGVYTLSLPMGFAAGPHSVVAKFTPTDVKQFQVSQSGPQSFTTSAPQVGACASTGSQCTDTQNVQVTVPAGTLVINTPYTASNPLDLGTMTPNTAGTQLTASKPFQNIVITDLRNGVSGYTVSAQSSDLTDGKANAGSTINSQNVGLTGVTGTGGTGFTGTITPHANPAADPAVAPGAAGTAGLGNAAHPVLDVTGTSRGTVTANGTLTINAPTSTEPGLFTGTITFTVG